MRGSSPSFPVYSGFQFRMSMPFGTYTNAMRRGLPGTEPDASGTFPNGKSFATPAEMRTLLKDEVPEFARCLTEKMLTYSLGRGVQRFDRKTVQDINRKLEADGYRFQTLIYQIVHSLPFQARRGEVLKSEKPAKPKEVARR